MIKVIGDIHGRDVWKKIVNDDDQIVFIGDYVDSYDKDFLTQLHNLKEIITYKKENKDRVILLIGNHDLNYFDATYNNGTSGFQGGAKGMQFGQLFEENKELFQMCYIPKEKEFENLIFSHAGIGEQWLEAQGWKGERIDEFVNSVWLHKPKEFLFNGSQQNGDDTWQTPVWIRPRSLMSGTPNLKKLFIQIVGHTQVMQIDIKGRATGGRFYFIDCLHDNKYITIDPSFKLHTV